MLQTVTVAVILCVTAAQASGNGENAALVAVAAPESLRHRLQTQVEASVATQSWAAKTVEHAAATTLSRCVSGERASCAAQLFSQTRAVAILFVRAEVSRSDDGEPRVVLRGRLIDRVSGKVLGAGQRHCLRCHDEPRLVQLAGELATDLIRARAAELAPHTGIRVQSIPADTLVVLNGSEAGPSGQAYRVPPGPQLVVVKREGYESVTKRVELRPNQELVLEVELVKKDRSPRGKPARIPSRIPVVLAAASAASLALGVTWLVVHQDSRDGDSLNRTARDSRVHGIVATSMGAVLAVAAGYWWVRDRRALRSPQLGLTPRRGGAIVTWTGSLR